MAMECFNAFFKFEMDCSKTQDNLGTPKIEICEICNRKKQRFN